MSSLIPITTPLQNITKTLIPPMPLWLYRYLALFPVTGFLGLDHLAIGSEYSFFIKLIVNFLTLGSWYAYDIVQIYNKKAIYKDGLDVPFFNFGGIGVERINAEPIKNMSNNTKLWLYILFICLFGSIYYITSFFTSNNTDILSKAIYILSTSTFWITILLAIYTFIFYFITRGSGSISSVVNNLSSSITNPLSSMASATNPLSSMTSATNPLTSITSATNPLTSITSAAMPQFGGSIESNDYKELEKISSQIFQTGGKSTNLINKEYIVFGIILAIIPISGFLVYYLRKNKTKSKKDEESNGSR